MLTQINAVNQQNEELRDRAARETIVHETVPGEDKIMTEREKELLKDKASTSTSDEDVN